MVLNFYELFFGAREELEALVTLFGKISISSFSQTKNYCLTLPHEKVMSKIRKRCPNLGHAGLKGITMLEIVETTKLFFFEVSGDSQTHLFGGVFQQKSVFSLQESLKVHQRGPKFLKRT